MNSFARLLGSFALLAVIVAAGVLWFLPEDATISSITTQTSAVKVQMPVDLSGEWVSTESKSGTKFYGHVKNNTMHVEMYANDGYTGLWYGTFDILQVGQSTLVSKAIDDPNHFVLSSAKTKDFLYQKGSLVFEFTVMGTRTTIEMKRV